MNVQRMRVIVAGQVQGVGFRPTVYRVATRLGLAGEVKNTSEGVVIEVQGPPQVVATFPDALQSELAVRAPLARVTALHTTEVDALPGDHSFDIVHSSGTGGHDVLISPDVATCDDCLADMRAESTRRTRYPFTNCTNCGPRYTITRSIPYDRPATSMSEFVMCAACQHEYDDPLDRRFHAQPNACTQCGPQVWLEEADGTRMADADEAMAECARRLVAGEVLAIKGLGGFHLAVNARDEAAVARLRQRKNRKDKPLAVMLPDVAACRIVAKVSDEEAALLSGMVRPIVLLQTTAANGLASGLSPDTDRIGVMLPYTPLHHVLFEQLRAQLQDDAPPALVMTSGNVSGEPIALANDEARTRLARTVPLADALLLHDRDILIRCDDSVVRTYPQEVDANGPLFLRRARGYTPAPILLPPLLSNNDDATVLGTGAQLKCAFCLTRTDKAFMSQHIGDMEDMATHGFYEEIYTHLCDILQVSPVRIVHDLHPDFSTTHFATRLGRELDIPVHALQHHMAHAWAIVAEHRLEEPAVVLALDGTGLGEDGTLWGGECIHVAPATATHTRLGHLAPFRLPGGEAAIHEPWRIAAGLLTDTGADFAHSRWLDPAHHSALPLVQQMLERNLNCPQTTSLGRLFDAVSALTGVRQTISYEGQAAIALEAVQADDYGKSYAWPLVDHTGLQLDTHALFAQVVADVRAGVDTGRIAARFHAGVLAGLVELAAVACTTTGTTQVGLSGGVLNNMTIAAGLVRALGARGLTPLLHTQVPPGDGCIALGQAHWGRLLTD